MTKQKGLQGIIEKFVNNVCSCQKYEIATGEFGFDKEKYDLFKMQFIQQIKEWTIEHMGDKMKITKNGRFTSLEFDKKTIRKIEKSVIGNRKCFYCKKLVKDLWMDSWGIIGSQFSRYIKLIFICGKCLDKLVNSVK